MTDENTVSEKTLKEKTEKAWKNLLKKHPSASPNQFNLAAFFIGGQPGAGKSTTQKKILKHHFNNNALFISIDDFREYHPNFREIYNRYGADFAQYTHKFAATVADGIRKKAIEQKYNIIIEGTFKSYDGIVRKIDELNKNGYECNIAVIACPKELSYFSTKDRIDRDRLKGQTIRGVPTDIHDETIKVLANNIQKLFENTKYNIFEIRYRDGTKLYSNKENITDKSPKEVLDREINRNLAKDEIDFIRISGTIMRKEAIVYEIDKLIKIEGISDLMRHLDEVRKFDLQHTGDVIIKNSKAKGIFNGKIDEEKLEKNINEALQGHFKLHQKTVLILNDFVEQIKEMKNNMKIIFSEKNISKEYSKKEEIKKFNKIEKDNDIEI
ncbi:MAG: zeta toxin family protein [Endomicrobium sp.]|jgi:UDP-N-acetylglucosamine kinase|nr:zeta toxin family protein [Endomicrobium sp.]